jgi:hypothetical protein
VADIGASINRSFRTPTEILFAIYLKISRVRSFAAPNRLPFAFWRLDFELHFAGHVMANATTCDWSVKARRPDASSTHVERSQQST